MQQTKTEIQQAVVDQLMADARVNPETIDVSVDDGQVTLRGTAPSYRAKWAAAEAARRVWGVFDVRNEIEVEIPAQSDDQRIANDIRSALLRDADLDSRDINVVVQEGNVLLEGTVSTLWAKIRAEEDARWTRNVISVKNKLTVVPEHSLEDREIAIAVEQALQRDSAVRAENIDVTVSGRHVTLSGVVSSWAERNAALDDALHVPGVSDVRDSLSIRYSLR